MNKTELNMLCAFFKLLAESKQDWSNIQKESYKLLVDSFKAKYEEERFWTKIGVTYLFHKYSVGAKNQLSDPMTASRPENTNCLLPALQR